jgi:general secretion pathway protein M
VRTGTDRWRALGVLAALLALAYLVLVHWWFTAPMLELGDQVRDLAAQEHALRTEIAERPALQRDLDRLHAYQSGHPAFLAESSQELASAGLVQRLEQVMATASPNPNACQITARTPSPVSNASDPYARVTVQVRLRCRMNELAAVLHALESGNPQLFIDNLDLLSRRSYMVATPDNNGIMDVSFDLYGYLPNPPGDGND